MEWLGWQELIATAVVILVGLAATLVAFAGVMRAIAPWTTTTWDDRMAAVLTKAADVLIRWADRLRGKQITRHEPMAMDPQNPYKPEPKE